MVINHWKEHKIVSAAPSTSVAPIHNRVQSLNAENTKSTLSAHCHSGRSVNEIAGGQGDIAMHSLPAGQGCIKNESGKHHSEIFDMQWQSHCQFYSECSHCLRLQTKPSIDNATRPIVIIDTSESCQRIKPKSNVRRRIFVKPLTQDDQELLSLQKLISVPE